MIDEIVSTVSEGSMFRTMKARSGTKYVILKATRSDDSMARGLLRREYELGKDLSHPCIAATLGWEDSTPAGPAIVMEYIDGRPFDQFVESGPSSRESKAVLKDILDGVEYLHHKGVVHNDLKPANILVTPRGTACIIDLGLSGSDDSIFDGVIGGTEGFTAPEVLEGKEPASTASDIYSLGRIIHLLSGMKRYGPVVAKCCRSDSAKRYQNVAQVRKALRTADNRPLVTVLTIVTAIAMSLIAGQIMSHRGSDRTEAVPDQVRNRIEADMGKLYRPVLGKIQSCGYFETASLYKNLYETRFTHYRDSIIAATSSPDGKPFQKYWVSPEHCACETVYAEHCSALNEIILSLPSTTTLPGPEQDSAQAIIEEVAVICKKQLESTLTPLQP